MGVTANRPVALAATATLLLLVMTAALLFASPAAACSHHGSDDEAAGLLAMRQAAAAQHTNSGAAAVASGGARHLASVADDGSTYVRIPQVVEAEDSVRLRRLAAAGKLMAARKRVPAAATEATSWFAALQAQRAASAKPTHKPTKSHRKPTKKPSSKKKVTMKKPAKSVKPSPMVLHH